MYYLFEKNVLRTYIETYKNKSRKQNFILDLFQVLQQRGYLVASNIDHAAKIIFLLIAQFYIPAQDTPCKYCFNLILKGNSKCRPFSKTILPIPFFFISAIYLCSTPRIRSTLLCGLLQELSGITYPENLKET